MPTDEEKEAIDMIIALAAAAGLASHADGAGAMSSTLATLALAYQTVLTSAIKGGAISAKSAQTIAAGHAEFMQRRLGEA